MSVMTTYHDSFDMSSWSILTDFSAGDFGFESADIFTVFNATQKYVFAGSGFTYDSNGVPTDGTITHIKVMDQSGGADNVQVTGLNLTVQQLETFALTNDINGFESAIFSGNDTFNVGNSDFHNANAVVHLNGFGGNDTFNFGYDFNSSDTIDGGIGYNTVEFSYSPGEIAPDTFHNIQKIVLTGGGNILDIEDADMSGGKTLTIDASQATPSGNFMQILANVSTNVHLIGSSGNDLLVGTPGNDQFTGGLGYDYLSGNGGHDTFIYNSVAESTGQNFDSIRDFNAKLDHFEMPNAVTAVDTAITTGLLDSSNFDADMSTALNGHLGANHAILFTPDSGNYAGDTLLVVDQSGQAGYQSGGDIIILVNGSGLTPQHLDLLSTANFIV